MMKPSTMVLSFRVINRKGETLSTHATRVQAATSTIALVSSLTGERLTIEGLPSEAGTVLTFKSLL
jgi:hypothetical protein